MPASLLPPVRTSPSAAAALTSCGRGRGRTQRERMLAGDPYIADDPEILRDSRRAIGLCERYNRTSVLEPDERRRILAELFADVSLVALDVAPIRIGEDVLMASNVQLLTATHPLEPAARRAKWESAQPIAIGDKAWLGGGAIVLPGVSIGQDTVVGAGAVVVRDLPAGVLAVGNPARIVRNL